MGKEIMLLEERQAQLKNEINALKKRIPYIIFGLILFIIALVSLFEEKINVYFGNSINLLYFCGALFIFLLISFWMNINKRINKRQLEIKAIKSKVYKLMKLNA